LSLVLDDGVRHERLVAGLIGEKDFARVQQSGRDVSSRR
jgi:hypothetical protein